MILLSNRVHPSRKNRKISEVRRAFADAVITAVKKSEKKVR